VSLGFIISESFAGIRRAKLPFSISVMTLTLTLTLIGAGIMAVDNILSYVYSIQSQFDVEVFFLDTASDAQISKTAEIIAEYPGVNAFKYLSKEDAAELFKTEFGEDIMNILDDNPLPASIRVQFNQASRNTAKFTQFSHDIESLSGVGEALFRMDIFERLQGFLRIIYYMSAAALLALIITAVFLTSNTIRLMILARFDVIETVRLLGASDFFIKAPFFLEGSIQGFLGGLFAVGIIHGLEEVAIGLLGINLSSRLLDFPFVLAGLLLLGVSLASIGSLRAVRRFLQFVI
jgi:cell division transport system permease protein